jgi:hypothetical protein
VTIKNITFIGYDCSEIAFRAVQTARKHPLLFSRGEEKGERERERERERKRERREE